MTAFHEGARGFVVRELQHALGHVHADGIFGPATRAAVLRLQARSNLARTGAADAALFHAASLKWPDAFKRCLNLTAEFEGTGFGGCNPTDIDGAGLTYGIIGFTTQSGEVQALLRSFLAMAPDQLRGIDHPGFREEIECLLSGGDSPREWQRFAFGDDGRVRSELARALHAWSAHPLMQWLQIAFACWNFWLPAEACARRLGFSSTAARGFFFDVWVQNGPWRAAHARGSAAATAQLAEPDRLRIMAQAVAAAAKARWRNDVLARKMLFAEGQGVVHGLHYSLRAQALA